MASWACYDEVADAYARSAVPRYFRRPARHLVRLLCPVPAERFLDVGCGTGAVAAEAATLMGGPERVSGMDVSAGMLVQARSTAACLVVAALPALPWRAESFDVVAGGFVLNHVREVAVSLAEIRRVLRPQGRVGISSWQRSPSESEAGEEWVRLASAFVEPEVLRAAVEERLPGAQRFSAPAGLADALSAAGFTIELAEAVSFPVTLPTDEYVDSRLLALGSRYMKNVLPAVEWRRFTRAVRKALRERFGTELTLETGVSFAVGSR